MTVQTASGIPPPNIVVSSRDYDRLEQLLEGPTSRGQLTAILLMKELLRADVLDESKMPDGVVTMGSTVKCTDEASGHQHTLTLVYPHEANVDNGLVSILTPVGSALLGVSIGEAIDWPAPGGRRLRLRVTDILRRPLPSTPIATPA